MSFVKKAIKRIRKSRLKRVLQKIHKLPEINAARLKVALAPQRPSFLGPEELKLLQARYPVRNSYKYDDQSKLDRGLERARRILELPGAESATSFLEVGCGDGMTAAMLHRLGKSSTGIDLGEHKFDPRAFEEGAILLGMNAERLSFEDSSFDYVVSFNSFEHFSQPARVLDEMIRVLRPGGYIYLDFGPLCHAPFGEHAYRTITVPYCQFLFTLDTMNQYAEEHGLKPIDPEHVNRWSLEDYRELWESRKEVLNPVFYKEIYHLSHLDLLKKYPSCFKGKVHSFENYLVSKIQAVFKFK